MLLKPFPIANTILVGMFGNFSVAKWLLLQFWNNVAIGNYLSNGAWGKLYFDWGWGGWFVSGCQSLGVSRLSLAIILVIHRAGSPGKRIATLKIQEGNMHGLAGHCKPSPLWLRLHGWAPGTSLSLLRCHMGAHHPKQTKCIPNICPLSSHLCKSYFPRPTWSSVSSTIFLLLTRVFGNNSILWNSCLL